jgi:hypothetical protein
MQGSFGFGKLRARMTGFGWGLGGEVGGAILLDHETEEAEAGGVVGDFAVALGDGEIALGDGEIDLGDGEIDLGGGEIDLGDGEIALGGGEINLGDGEIDLGDGEINLGDVEIDLGGKGDGEWRRIQRDGRWIGVRSEGG